MRITFILPVVPPLTGGTKVVFQYCNHLVTRGHTVNLVFPAQLMDQDPYVWFGAKARLRVVKHDFMRRRQGQPFDWFPLDTRVRVCEVPGLQEKHIPDAEIIVATQWTTAPWVNGYAPRKGKKFYLIQHYEAVMGPQDRVDATWRMPLRKIVIATWLQELAESKFGAPPYAMIMNGFDFREFYNDHKLYHAPRRVGMMYHHEPWKGIPDGLRAVELARQKHPDLSLILFGVYAPAVSLPDYAEFHLRPFGEQLRKLYCSFDIFLSPSWSEGSQAPPLEAMACQCAVVATNVGGIPDYALSEETVLTAPPQQPEKLALQLIRLLDDERLLQRISTAGSLHIRQYTWERSAGELEAAFQRAQGENAA